MQTIEQMRSKRKIKVVTIKGNLKIHGLFFRTFILSQYSNRSNIK